MALQDVEHLGKVAAGGCPAFCPGPCAAGELGLELDRSRWRRFFLGCCWNIGLTGRQRQLDDGELEHACMYECMYVPLYVHLHGGMYIHIHKQNMTYIHSVPSKLLELHRNALKRIKLLHIQACQEGVPRIPSHFKALPGISKETETQRRKLKLWLETKQLLASAALLMQISSAFGGS